MSNVPTPTEITKLEREIEANDKALAKAEAKFEAELAAARNVPFPDQGKIENLEARLEAVRKALGESTEKYRAALDYKRGQLAAHQAHQVEQRATEAARLEAREKLIARRHWKGDDASFEQAWPAMYQAMLESETRAEVERENRRRPLVRL